MTDSGVPLVAPFQHKFHAPIGEYVMEFGQLERALDESITSLLLVSEKQGSTITSQINSVRTKANIYRELCWALVKNPTLRTEAQQLSESLKVQNKFRNNLVHGPFESFVIPAEKWRKVSINPQNFQEKYFEVTVSEILKMRADALILRNHIVNFAGSCISAHQNGVENLAWHETNQQLP